MLKIPFNSNKSLYTIFIGITLFFVVARYLFLGGNFSQFIIAGSDFTNQETVAENTIVHKGQGYDGQFFYRYAHNPLNIEKTAYGVTVDHLEYRIQRIIYPATVWLFSLGGNPKLIPFALVLCNLLAFIGIFFFSLRFCQAKKVDPKYALLPLFVFGAYMSLARDTSEIFEVFFFVLAVYAITINNIYLYVLSIFLSIFSRETSLIAIGPLTLVYGLSLLKSSKIKPLLLLKLSILVLPFLAIIFWKYYLHVIIHSEQLVDGSQNLSFPFYGLYLGFLSSINFIDMTHTLETLFWMSYLFWNIWFIFIVINRMDFKNLFNLDLASKLNLVFLIWALFALFFGHAIYIDDWGFVRIFTLFNMLGFLIIMLSNKGIKKYFFAYSSILLLLTLVRLIVRI